MDTAIAPPFPTADPVPIRARRRFRWYHVLLAMIGAGVVSILALVVTLYLSFGVGSEVRALRDAALEASPGTWERQVEFGVGRLPVLLAKAGLSFAPLEPEARAAISALQSADVAVYERRGGANAPDPTAVFAQVRAIMTRKGWEPVALVKDGRDAVGVFLPKSVTDSSRLTACVFVMDDSDLVVVSARANLQPLIDLGLASMDRIPVFAKK